MTGAIRLVGGDGAERMGRTEKGEVTRKIRIRCVY